MISLISLIFILWGSNALREERNFLLDGEIRHFAVASNLVYVSTEESLYQLNHDLTLVSSLSQKGVLVPTTQQNVEHFHRVSEGSNNATLRVNVLLPFVENGSLIVCGVTNNQCGYCEVVDLRNISRILHKEHVQVGSLRPSSSSSVSFLVRLETKRNPIQVDSYIMTAIQYDGSEESSCSSDAKTVNLQDTDDKRGGIFSLTDSFSGTPSLEAGNHLEFVDGFQINSTIYLLSNAPRSRRVRLFWLEDRESKSNTLKSLRGATLAHSLGWKLKASSVLVEGETVLLAGVFAVDGGNTDTELLVFDVSPGPKGESYSDPDLFYNKDKTTASPKILRQKAVLLKQSSMTSVLAVRQKEWRVFFIGTGDGQLIKLAVDRNFHSACPKVLYKSNHDRRVFPRMHLDQVDPKHVYMALTNELMRVPVSKCSLYKDVKKCWFAQDPHCGWCSSKKSCTFEDDCTESEWLSIPNVSKEKIISHRVLLDPSGQLKLNTEVHVSVNRDVRFACQHSIISGELCIRSGTSAQFPQCTCLLTKNTLPAEGLNVTVKMEVGSTILTEQLRLTNCTELNGPATSVLCRQCIQAGCGWSKNGCSWAEGLVNEVYCQKLETGMNYQEPEISSITPNEVSFYGRNHVVMSGRNLSDVIAVRIQAESSCTPVESPVWNNTGTTLMFHIPSTNTKGEVKVCAVLPDGGCHGNSSIYYKSSPSCSKIFPQQSWMSGKRNITISGSHLDFVEGIAHSNAPQDVKLPLSQNFESLTYESPAASNPQTVSVLFKVGNQDVICTQMIYYPDPEFIRFTVTVVGNDDVRVIIEKKPDKLNMTTAELSVWGVQEEKPYPCEMEVKTNSEEPNFLNCDIKGTSNLNFKEIQIKYGDKTIPLELERNWLLLLLLLLLLIPAIIVVVLIVTRSQQKKLTKKMNRFMEDLELDIRNDIRQGFVDLQTEKADLMENVGTIPFLDYKHFASRIFFPESEPLLKLCVKDMAQDTVKVELDSGCQALSRLLQDQVFLTSMVHALEEQKSFNIKDKCALASLLTVALHSDLSYLTEVMEVLLQDLMQRSSNMQPKLLLRRTESTVEKLLTNWMSICLYGFLRESVGQHLFLMVSALTQQISKGPVDCVTEKALYTLNEDWLLWQATDFSLLRLKVLFAVGSDGGVSEPLEVEALSCDTVEQLKDKILSTFKAKFGFPYNTALRDARIEFEKNGSFVPLEEVDASSEVIGEVTMLNTLKHYKVDDGATIKVLSKKSHPPVSPQGSLKDDENFSGKYFHLIDPDVVEDQRKNPERKKLKVKEVHLTKLLSTKVAVHSFVENLFRSIWATSSSKIPHAIKYFFDFLDTQAENMKISDPDVLHIWKTNSLPLRFWVNILKNPQFVFDMEKSPHVDGCLSVIAQAFIDSFSLSEVQLGKHAPTNKLLYAKDIPNYKKEVKTYYKHIRDQPAISQTQFTEFLRQESKKHENEFNEAAALRELYRFIQRYYTEIKEKLDQSGAPAELTEQLQHVKASFDGLKSCSWD